MDQDSPHGRNKDLAKQLVTAGVSSLLTAAGVWFALRLRPSQTVAEPPRSAPDSSHAPFFEVEESYLDEPIEDGGQVNTEDVPKEATDEGLIPDRIERPVRERAPDVLVNVIANLIAGSIGWLVLQAAGVVSHNRTLTIGAIGTLLFAMAWTGEVLLERRFGPKGQTLGSTMVMLVLLAMATYASHLLWAADRPWWYKTVLFIPSFFLSHLYDFLAGLI